MLVSANLKQNVLYSFIATVLVLVYANSSWAEKYADVWQTKLTAGLGGVEEAVTLRA
jgi:Na+/H+ antiporter NhaA